MQGIVLRVGVLTDEKGQDDGRQGLAREDDGDGDAQHVACKELCAHGEDKEEKAIQGRGETHQEV